MIRSRLAPVSRRRRRDAKAWAVVRTAVFARAQGQCEVVLNGMRCRRAARDPHHVIKRSQGGADDAMRNLVAVCRTHHAQTDAAYAQGRLVIRNTGPGTFTFEVVTSRDKWATRNADRTAS